MQQSNRGKDKKKTTGKKGWRQSWKIMESTQHTQKNVLISNDLAAKQDFPTMPV